MFRICKTGLLVDSREGIAGGADECGMMCAVCVRTPKMPGPCPGVDLVGQVFGHDTAGSVAERGRWAVLGRIGRERIPDTRGVRCEGYEESEDEVTADRGTVVRVPRLSRRARSTMERNEGSSGAMCSDQQRP